jgi:hypothetical protein
MPAPPHGPRSGKKVEDCSRSGLVTWSAPILANVAQVSWDEFYRFFPRSWPSTIL